MTKIFKFTIVILFAFFFLSCEPQGNGENSFFYIPQIPDNPPSNGNELPDIPNEPGFYVNGEHKGILLFNDILDWINNNVKDGDVYGIVLHQNIAINPVTFNYPGKNVFIILKGNAEGRYITLATKGALFTIRQGVTFGLQENIELRGIPDNNSHLVDVGRYGKFIMDNGVITGNTSNGGTGGVLAQTGSVFIFNGGKIYNNKATQTDYIIGGGGIGVAENAEFIMTGGEIFENTATIGGGISIRSGKFTITGGKILNNNSTRNGGGIYLYPGNTDNWNLVIENLEIGNNKAGYNGGGIYSHLSGTSSVLTLEKTIIYGNIAESILSTEGKGGGVYNRGSNTSGRFIKKPTGGIIYGTNAETDLQNRSSRGGNAVHHDKYSGLYVAEEKIRNNTVTEYVELDSNNIGEWE